MFGELGVDVFHHLPSIPTLREAVLSFGVHGGARVTVFPVVFTYSPPWFKPASSLEIDGSKIRPLRLHVDDSNEMKRPKRFRVSGFRF